MDQEICQITICKYVTWLFHLWLQTLLLWKASPKKPFWPLWVLIVTQFAWPCLLASFWLVFCRSGSFRSPTSGCPCLPAEETLTVSHFSVKRLRVFPQDWHLKSANQFPFSPAQCPSARVPLWSFKWQDTKEKKFVIKNSASLLMRTDNRRRLYRFVPTEAASGRSEILIQAARNLGEFLYRHHDDTGKLRNVITVAIFHCLHFGFQCCLMNVSELIWTSFYNYKEGKIKSLKYFFYIF